MPAEPKGLEPAALARQAAEAVGKVAAAGWLPARAAVAEYGSPHGGSWLELLAARGLRPVRHGAGADVIIDSFGMMHAADQHAALAERVARLSPGGVLLLQYHALGTILVNAQWNALRHGHYAYYSTTALTAMLAGFGLHARMAWRFELYGGTVLLAATRDDGRPSRPDGSVESLLAEEAGAGVRSPEAFSSLQCDMRAHTQAVHDWLLAQRASGTAVLGYGAASRAVAMLCQAHVDHTLLPAVVDASPAKHGLRMPGTDIPITGPAELAARRPAAVLLFVPDLLAEVRTAYPEVERSGGRWINADTVGSRSLQQDT